MRFFNRMYSTRTKSVYDYSGYTINRRKKRVYGKKTDNIKAGGATKNSSGNKITLKENAVARLIHSVIDFFAGKKTFFFIAFIVIVALFSLIPTERVIILGEKTYFAMEMAVLADEGTAYTLAGEIMALGGGNIIRKDDGFRILASIYASKEDALAVIEKNERYGFSPSLYTWEIPSFEFSFKSSVLSFSTVENTLNYLFDSTNEIITLSVELDRGNKTDSEISSATKKLEADGEKIIKALHRAFPSSDTDVLYRYVERTIGFISEMNASLSSSSIKTCYGKMLTNLSDFAGEFI